MTDVETLKLAESLKIPKAKFIEDVDAYMKETGKTVDEILKSFQGLHRQYEFMEAQFSQKKSRYRMMS